MQLNCVMFIDVWINFWETINSCSNNVFFFTRDVCQNELVQVKLELDQQKKTQGSQL